MNWLAHLLLSGSSPAERIGGLLPDLATRAELKSLPEEFQGGIRLHYRIDAFTDSHPVVRRSVRRFGPRFRRFGGILADIFYDHFLSVEWGAYSEQSLEDFVSSVYASFEARSGMLSPLTVERLTQMKAANWLCSYRELSGVRLTVTRVGSRLRRPVDLGPSVDELENLYEEFRGDFSTFFPELVKFVRSDAVHR